MNAEPTWRASLLPSVIRAACRVLLLLMEGRAFTAKEPALDAGMRWIDRQRHRQLVRVTPAGDEGFRKLGLRLS